MPEKGSSYEADINYFFNNYEIIHQQLETASGFSGMIVRDKKQTKQSWYLEALKNMKRYSGRYSINEIWLTSRAIY
ncbi:hypothetical protein INT80_11285 [Gallibacterium anatis]|uniref:Uncharacterized protein n=1 Tax=Gallibacterium anatis TaxID=750 RepID=A0A930Y5C7_9PAST|nr:hypothetical protein [Gallibacterium anatis]